MNEFRLEITYEIKGTVSWTYLSVKARSEASAKEKAKKCFASWIKELGWSRIVSIQKIAPLRTWNDKPIHKRNSKLSDARAPVTSPPKRSTRKSGPNRTDTKKPTRTNSRTKPKSTSTVKPKRNRKVTEPAKRKPKSKPATTSRSSGAKPGTKRRSSNSRGTTKRSSK